MKQHRLFLILLAAAALLFLWRVCFDTGAPHPRLMQDMTARPATADAPHTPPPGVVPYGEPRPVAEAPTLFARHCATCHGADGSGRSYVAAQPGMPAVSDLRTNPVPAEQKQRSLTEGRGAMPAFGQRLTPAEQAALHRYILSFTPTRS